MNNESLFHCQLSIVHCQLDLYYNYLVSCKSFKELSLLLKRVQK
jgi:hypothetical protein